MKKSLVVMCLFVLLFGCGKVGKPTITLQNSYDADATRTLLENGDATIKGSALLRQAGGGVVTCAGNEVNLIPVTPYSTERISYLYGNTTRAFLDPYNQNISGFANDNQEYLASGMKKAMCDAQGYFKFNNIKPGAYYITTRIIWQAGYMPEGGGLMQKVDVAKGETKEIVLSR